MSAICKSCPTELGARNQSGFCRSCTAKRMNADPVVRANQRAGIRAFTAQPHVKAALRERAKLIPSRMSAEAIERRRERGRGMIEILHSPEVRARNAAPEVRAAAGRKRRETVLADIPPAYRERYLKMVRSNLARAAEARRMIADEVAADERRRLAAMTPFERQMEAVRNGAVLVDKFTPSRAYDRTLGGIASGIDA